MIESTKQPSRLANDLSTQSAVVVLVVVIKEKMMIRRFVEECKSGHQCPWAEHYTLVLVVCLCQVQFVPVPHDRSCFVAKSSRTFLSFWVLCAHLERAVNDIITTITSEWKD